MEMIPITYMRAPNTTASNLFRRLSGAVSGTVPQCATLASGSAALYVSLPARDTYCSLSDLDPSTSLCTLFPSCNSSLDGKDTTPFPRATGTLPLPRPPSTSSFLETKCALSPIFQYCCTVVMNSYADSVFSAYSTLTFNGAGLYIIRPLRGVASPFFSTLRAKTPITMVPVWLLCVPH